MADVSADTDVFVAIVAKSRMVWTMRYEHGFPVFQTSRGKSAQPFWSSRKRVERIIRLVATYAHFEPHGVSWDDFCEKCVPELIQEDLLVGVNWSGKRAIGDEIDPHTLVATIEEEIRNLGSR